MVKHDINLELLVGKFQSLSGPDDEDPGKKRVLTGLFRLFTFLVRKKEFQSLYPEFSVLYARVYRALDEGVAEDVEMKLIQLYCYLHNFDSGYSKTERKEFDAFGGYWCHAGGLSPLIKAAPFITPETRLADYGAGNGLQGLLFQYLYPHRRTCQIELSLKMIESGKRLQAFMGIPDHRMEWVHKNIIDVSPDRFDFIYIYRPVRPEGRGREFYENLARDLDRVEHRLTIFSVADCLQDFLSARFRRFYDDGQLACFSNEGLHGMGPGERESSSER